MECSQSPDMPTSKYWKPGVKQLIHPSTTRTVINGTSRFLSHESVRAGGGSVSGFTAGQSAVFVPPSKISTAGSRFSLRRTKRTGKSNRFVHSWMAITGGKFGLVSQQTHEFVVRGSTFPGHGFV